MELHPLVFIGSIVIPLLLTAGAMVWVLLVRKNRDKQDVLLTVEKQKYNQKDRENQLLETLVSYKDKQISILQDKLNSNKL